MKRRLFQRTFGLLFSMAILLVGCSSSNNISKAKEPIPVSKAFSQAGIWFKFDRRESVAKDQLINSIYYFDGKGNVTEYLIKRLTFSDLRDKNTEQILELAKAQDKLIHQSGFEDKREELLKSFNESLSDINRAVRNDNPEFYELLVNTAEAMEKSKAYEFIQNLPFNYEGASAFPYKLTAETDQTGNAIQLERINSSSITHYYDIADPDAPLKLILATAFKTEPKYRSLADEASLKELDELDEKINKGDYSMLQIVDLEQKYDIELEPDLAVSQVYDMYFRGFNGFVTLVDDETHAGFKLDSVDTEGIILD